MTVFRSLFLKIFLWFGGIVLTVILITFLASEILRPRGEQRMRRPIDPILNVYAKDAAEQFEKGGQPALKSYLDRIETETHISAFLFDEEYQELSGKPVSQGSREVAHRVFSSGLPEFSEDGPSPLLARPVRTSSGERYVLVAALPPHPEPWFLHPVLHLIAITLLGALFSYGLARYLTSPVTKLRKATREIANGNLSARVMPRLGRRRDELVSLAADFDEMAEKIQTLINSQRRLLGDISHELRSPLARLNVALELARQRTGQEALNALERIQTEAELLNEMIGQLLALTRLETSAIEIQKTEIDLQSLVADIAKDADFEARAHNRSVILRGTEPVVVTGGPNLIRSAIENVVRNGVHHTTEGTEVEISLKAVDANAVVVVRDHGPGVPAEALQEIFRPFYRVDEARNREAGGVGLGLAIAQRAVKLHGGEIQAANSSGGGLTVTITVPKE